MSWQTVKIGEIAGLKYGKMPPKSVLTDTGYPIFSGYRITGFAKEYLYQDPQLIIVARGVGGTGDVKISPPTSWITNLSIVIDLDQAKAAKKYLFYMLRREGLKEKLNTGAAQAQITIASLESYPIRLPTLEKQKRIADILSAYDDLIENNRRRIELLEKSARMLYKEWFVHFRYPGHEHAPLVDGIPQGWLMKDLSDLITIKHGYAFKGEFFEKEKTSRVLLTPGNFKIGGGLQLNKVKYYAEYAPLPEDFVLNAGDLLTTMTDLSKTSDTLGFPLLVPEEKKTMYLHNQRLGKIEPIDPQVFPKPFLYYVFQDNRFRQQIVGSATGTSVKHTAPKRILSCKIPLPPSFEDPLIQDFNSSVQASIDQIENLEQMNKALQKARDLLLPKLMNGEIEV